MLLLCPHKQKKEDDDELEQPQTGAGGEEENQYASEGMVIQHHTATGCQPQRTSCTGA